MKNLNDLPAPVLKAIAKMATDAMKGRRDELGQVKAEFAVDQTVVLHAKGTVTVAKSTPDAIVAQSAKPWAIVHTLLTELNRERDAAGKVGIDIAKVVEMAEAADPDLVKKAKNAADSHVRSIKEEVRQFKWGSTSVKGGEVSVLATGDHLAEEAAGE
jgi:hypothetical protein